MNKNEITAPSTKATVVINGYLYHNPNYDPFAAILSSITPAKQERITPYVENPNHKQEIALLRRANQVFGEYLKNEQTGRC